MKKLVIGRDAGNQIVLNHNFVSRKHAELIIMDNGQVMIRDLGSSNGTFVNGKRITESYIKAGDIVKCASIVVNWQQYVTHTAPKEDKKIIPPPVQKQQPNPGYVPPPVQKQQPNPPYVPPPVQKQQPVPNYVPPPVQKQQPVPPYVPPPEQKQQAVQSQPILQNIFVIGKAKSVGVAFLLAFFFGPLGLFYASVIGGIVMLLINILLFATLLWPLLIVSWVACIIWACVAADQANKKMANAPLIQNQYNQQQQ
jgi:hypothetical protein